MNGARKVLATSVNLAHAALKSTLHTLSKKMVIHVHSIH